MFRLSRIAASFVLLALPMLSRRAVAQDPAGRITGRVTDSSSTRPLTEPAPVRARLRRRALRAFMRYRRHGRRLAASPCFGRALP